MNLSVCFIVKNEEKQIERILKCVKEFADEIIIVDTGSTDNTKNICKRYTNKIYDFEWVDDFSKARNFSFSKATKDYIMWLDADDFITKENIEKIIKLKNENKKTDIFMCKYDIAFDKNNKPTFSYFRERIVKNNNKNTFSGFLHEAINLSGFIEYTEISIEHRKIKMTNPKRNLNIYNKKLKEGIIFNTREQYYYSKELFYNGYFKKCVKELKKYLKMNNKYTPNILDSYLTISLCFKRLNNYEKALTTLIESLKVVKPNSEIVCEIASLFLYYNKIDSAIFFYESALNILPDYNSGNFIQTEFYYYVPLLQLCMLYYNKNYKKSKEYHLKLKNDFPNNEKVIYNDRFFQK